MMTKPQPCVTPVRWSLVVPLKPLVQAKSRLAVSVGDALRPHLALAFAQDTVSAALSATAVRSVAVVTNDDRAARELSALGARIVPDAPGRGLNSALAHGETVLRSGIPENAVAALNADLPALRPEELDGILDSASGFPRSFLADSSGIGTTLLSAMPGHPLTPAFGGLSAAAHRRTGAVELDGTDAASVRRDVDTGSDLRAARALGTGPFTTRLLDRTALPAPRRTPGGSRAPDGGRGSPGDRRDLL